jgi:F-type H+-transporting ATPase subunit b
MEELLHKLGINWKLLIAQAVNFAIVLIVLYRFVYKPVLKMLKQRKEKIKKSLKDAERVEENLKKSKIERENQIALGRKEAEKIIAQAKKKSEEIKNEKVEEAKKEEEAIIKTAKQRIRAERQNMIDEAKLEIGELVLLASKKVTKDSIDEQTHKKLINEAIDELKKTEIK